MFRIRILAGLLAIGATIGCRAQAPSTAGGSHLDPTIERRIDVLVRSQYSLPPDVNLHIGARTSSQFAGYQTLPVTLSRGSKTQVVEFLISTDNTKLLHMETFDLLKDPGSNIDIAGRPVRGNPQAKVTVINFDDLECPYCARMHEELFPATLDHYKGKVRFIYKDNPLTGLHPWAMRAAVDANCLAAQSNDVYWTYVDYLHSHGDEISGTDRDPAKSYATLDRVARQEGTLGKLDASQLDACLIKQDETKVKTSQQEAETLGLEGAPALFINGERITGAVPADQLWLAIDRALRAAGEEPPARNAGAGQSAAGTGAGK